MTEKKSATKRGAAKRSFRISPESEKWLKERLATPEGQELLDELARIYVDIAVRRLIKEDALHGAAQAAETTLP